MIGEQSWAINDRVIDPIEAYNQLADDYDETYFDPKSRAEDAVVRRMLRDGGFAKGTILEVGCGTSILLDWFPDLAPQYIGVDPSGRMLDKARAKHPEALFYPGSFENIPGHDQYDSVLSLYGSFSYAKSPHAAAVALLDRVAPGGSLFVMAYGKRYANRSTYILKNVPVQKTLFSAAELRAAFLPEEVTIRGVSATVDLLPEVLPQAVFDAASVLDAKLGRVLPDACFFLIAQYVR